MPLTWICILLIYGIFTKIEKRRKRSILAALILIMIFGNEFIINEVFSSWETKPVPIATLPNYDYAIVLTGITNPDRKEVTDRVYFSKGADRLLHTIQLYKMGKVKKIIISGGSSAIVTKGTIESLQLKKVFNYCGVPDSSIIIEGKSRNTRENALYTKQLIDSLHLNGKFLLITSAFHMRRSDGCFKKVGLTVDTYPVDTYVHDRKYTPNILFIPSESAFGKWALVIHEMIGYFVYKTIGYS